MSDIKIKHAGHEIVFREDQETWACHALHLEYPKLSALKARLNDLERTARRVNVKALFVGTRWLHDDPGAEVSVLLIGDAERAGYGRRNPDKMVIKSAYIKGPDGERQKVNISDLAPLSSRTEVAAWVIAGAKAADAAKAEEAAHAAIPRFDADSLMLAHKEAAAEAPEPKRRKR